jgi:plastocyanin
MFLLCAACGGDGGDAPAPSRKAATPIDPATTGTITVTVTYAGRVEPPREINMRSTPGCAAAHTGPVYEQSLLVRDGHLANAVVWIKTGLEALVFAPPSEPVVMDQRGCLYTPHVAAVMAGQPVEFRNSDPEAHNVHGKPVQAKGWNFLMSRQGTTRSVFVETPEVAIPVGCDIHPWMQAYVAVFPHPFFGVTAADGTVSLAGVPAGRYVVAAWHERLGTTEQAVTLAAKGTASLALAYVGP